MPGCAERFVAGDPVSSAKCATMQVMFEALSHAPLQKFTQADLAAVLSEYAALGGPAASHLMAVSPFTCCSQLRCLRDADSECQFS